MNHKFCRSRNIESKKSILKILDYAKFDSTKSVSHDYLSHKNKKDGFLDLKSDRAEQENSKKCIPTNPIQTNPWGVDLDWFGFLPKNIDNRPEPTWIWLVSLSWKFSLNLNRSDPCSLLVIPLLSIPGETNWNQSKMEEMELYFVPRTTVESNQRILEKGQNSWI